MSVFFKNFFAQFGLEETMTLAASLAFYTVFSLAPLLLLFIALSARLSPDLQENFVIQVHLLVGEQAAAAIEMIITNAKNRPDLQSMSGIISVILLLLSGSLIFGELRSTMDRIFQKQKTVTEFEGVFPWVKRFAKKRVVDIGLALSFIFALVVSLIVSTAISMQFREDLKMLNNVVSLAFYFLFFTISFRYLPTQHLPWKQCASGGAITAILFVVGKELIGLYIGTSAIGSAYGAAGSLIVLLVWVYYSALITFIGAEVSATLYSSPSAGRNVA